MRALRNGDLVARASGPPQQAGARVPPGATQPVQAVLRIRALPGPHLSYFSPAGIDTFFSSEYVVSPRSDRRGLRLEGPPVELVRPADLPPEGVAPGSVQVPGDRLPIVLGPDGPVTGGYPRVACVAGADLPLLAQARPGHRIRFERASLADALAAWRAR